MNYKYVKFGFVAVLAFALTACEASEGGAGSSSGNKQAEDGAAAPAQGVAKYAGAALGRYVDPATLTVTGLDESFATSDRLFAVVNLQDVTAGATVTAKLVDASGKVLAQRDAITSGEGQTYVNFDFDVPTQLALQPGEYSVDVAINGNQAGKVGFQVK